MISFSIFIFYLEDTGSQPLLLEGVIPSLPPPPPVDAAGACRKGKGVDFDASAEQPVVGQTTFSSLSRGLGPIAREYLGRATTLYKELLTGGLSQRIKED
ncbi:hypothetical protein ACOSQ2_022456 [Xanthoceras sorbifolium]